MFIAFHVAFIYQTNPEQSNNHENLRWRTPPQTPPIPSPPSKIPAVDTKKFCPSCVLNHRPSSPSISASLSSLPRITPQAIKICVMSRLTYRKGTDLLAASVPTILKSLPNSVIVIGGEGDLAVKIHESIESCPPEMSAQSRVVWLGLVNPSDVSSVLQSTDIFVNASLTESFCMSSLEAACCGNLVVTTDVGGVREAFAGTEYERDGGVYYVDIRSGGEGISEGVVRAAESLGRMRSGGNGEGEGGGGKVDGGIDSFKVSWWSEFKRIYSWDVVAEVAMREYQGITRRRSKRGRVEAWDTFRGLCEGRNFLQGIAAVSFFGAVWTFVNAWDFVEDYYSGF